MADKTMPLEDLTAHLESGMTIGVGGWGSRRKPMALIREILRSDLKDLTVVSYGGPEVGLLCASGKVRKAVYGFVSLDSIALDPHFRSARENGRIEVEEYDEGMFLAGLRAGAARLSFTPTRAGLESGVLDMNPRLKLIDSPYDDEVYVAMTGLRTDVSLIHLNRADAAGNGQYLGADPYFDDLFAQAADKTFMSVEKVVPTAELTATAPVQSLLVSRLFVDGVIETPAGAHFTSCEPDYGRDEAFQRAYADSGQGPAAWQAFHDRFLAVSETDYQAAVAAVANEDSR